MKIKIFSTFKFLVVFLLAVCITLLFLSATHFIQHLFASVGWHDLASVGWHGRM